MPTKTRKASSALAPRRSNASLVSKSKFEALRQRSAAAGARLRAARQEDTDAAVGMMSAVGLGLLESQVKLPAIYGYDPLLLVGPLTWFAGRQMKKSKMASGLRQAGLMVTGIATNRAVTRGSLKVGEDDSDDVDIDGEGDDLDLE